MTLGNVLWAVAANLLLVIGCESREKAKSSGDAPVATAPPDDGSEASPVHVEQPLGSSSPVFLVASDDERAIALLALKDDNGSARKLMGIAWIAGRDFLSLEFDLEGRLTRYKRSDLTVEVYGYTDDGLSVERRERDGELETRRLVLNAEELASLRVRLPNLDASNKDRGTLGEELVEFIDAAKELLGCFGKASAGVLPRLTRAADCAGLLKNLLNEGALKSAIAAGVAGTQCVLGIASVVTTPAGPIVIAGVVRECIQATQAVVELLYQERTKEGFVVTVGGDKLRKGERSTIDIDVFSRPWDPLLSLDLHVDLTAIGGPRPVLDLGATGADWHWRGEVSPREAGIFPIPLLVRGQLRPGASIVVEDEMALEAQIRAFPQMIRAGQSVTLEATIRGGREPYTYYWWAGVTNQSVAKGQGLARVSYAPAARTRISLSFFDSRPAARFGSAEDIWIDVCGDGLCTGEEDALRCPEDCTGDGGADAGPPEAMESDAGGLRDAAAGDEAETIETGLVDASPDGAYSAFDHDGTAESMCMAACGYRSSVLACPGDPYLNCAAVCLGLFHAASMQGMCEEAARALEGCRWSRSAIELGCGVSNDRIDQRFCGPQAAALSKCLTARDEPGSTSPADAGIAGATPAERCESACTYRSQVLGCGGVAGACEALCIALRSTYTGNCAAAQVALHDCHYSQAALDLGCTASDAQVDSRACPAEAAVVRACTAAR